MNLIFGKNHGKLSHERNLAPKIIHDHEYIFSVMKHEKHYEFLSQGMLVGMPLVEFKLTFLMNQKTLVPTWNISLPLMGYLFL